MIGQVFLAQGDITQLAADAVAFSSSRALHGSGDLYGSFVTHVPGFADAYAELSALNILAETGETFWLALPRHRVVVVAATGHIADAAALVVRNAICRAVHELRASGATQRLLIALPAFRLGGGGDTRDRLTSAVAQVRSAHETIQELGEVDVVFMTYTASLYRIYLEARRQVLGTRLATHWPDLEQALASGSCVLFVGAGLSSGAGLPSWDQLIAALCSGLGIVPSPTYDPLDVAQWYRDRFLAEGLAKVLRSTFQGAGLPTLAHYLLLALPLQYIITTNYDDLIERTLTALKRFPVTVIRQEDVSRTGGAGTYVVKLHGDANHPNDIVLSRDDYAAFFEQRPAMSSLLEGLLLNHSFLFVGYSLRDPNFRHLFSRVARMLREARRPAFATSFADPGPAEELVREQWRRERLELIPLHAAQAPLRAVAAWEFLDTLSERVTLRTPPLVMADDTPTPPVLGPIATLLAEAGNLLEPLSRRALQTEELRFLSDVIRLLVAHGWRPGNTRLSRLLERLAGQATEVDLRRELLVAALQAAEKLDHAENLREKLSKLT
jgi:hypothetical protein